MTRYDKHKGVYNNTSSNYYVVLKLPGHIVIHSHTRAAKAALPP